MGRITSECPGTNNYQFSCVVSVIGIKLITMGSLINGFYPDTNIDNYVSIIVAFSKCNRLGIYNIQGRHRIFTVFLDVIHLYSVRMYSGGN